MIVVTALLGACSPAAALDQNSGNYWIPKCHDLMNAIEGKSDTNEVTNGMHCFGIVRGVAIGLQGTGAICMSDASTYRQAIKLVIAEADRYPEMMDKPFGAIVIAVLMKRWPCKQKINRFEVIIPPDPQDGPRKFDEMWQDSHHCRVISRA